MSDHISYKILMVQSILISTKYKVTKFSILTKMISTNWPIVVVEKSKIEE